jgi:hypothetical protein
MARQLNGISRALIYSASLVAKSSRSKRAWARAHGVFAEQIAHRLELVVNERRRRWNNFFHNLMATKCTNGAQEKIFLCGFI